jgi:hypothetical protein
LSFVSQLKGLSITPPRTRLLPPLTLPTHGGVYSHTLLTFLTDNLRNNYSNCLSIFLSCLWLNYNFAI